MSYVLITCDTGHEQSIISELKEIKGIREVYGVFGTYDLITRIDESDRDSIISISNKIRNNPYVRATLTLFGNNGAVINKTRNQQEYESIIQHMAQAYVMITCQKDREQKILEKMTTIPEVIEVSLIVGQYDMAIQVAAPTYNEISDIVTKQIRKIDGIKSTNTLNVIQNK